jgi:hypothetical protein
MDKIYIVVAETMGTDGEFYSETYDCACSLIADMAETMEWERVNPETAWEIGNEEWWYRVRIDTHEW